MEFGIFIQGHAPSQARAHSPANEQRWIRNEVEIAQAADRNNFKYIWTTEHHFLEEYSHMSDNAAMAAWVLAKTERIHVGSGIFNLNPRVNHPIRLAERVAMLDQLSQGRFEFGTGRGAGSHEIGGFALRHDETKANWNEAITEIPKMWRQRGYSYPNGRSFQVPSEGRQMMPGREGAFNVLPKPYAHTHPALWVAAGNPGTYETSAKMGLGLLGFNVGSVWNMEPLFATYKEHIGDAEPVGDYVNDNIMTTVTMICFEDGKKARESYTRSGRSYLTSLVFRYHDSFPRPEGIPYWPETIPEPTIEDVDQRIKDGFGLCGSPDEVIKQVENYSKVGSDQLVFGYPADMPIDEALESIETFGKHVIPHFDKDPKHSTTRYREAAGGPLAPKG